MIQIKTSIKITLSILVLSGLFLIGFSCNKASSTNSATSGLVNQTINISYPQYSALNTIGNYVYIPMPNAGVRGIILYRYSQEQFNAYERSCTYNTASSCGPVVVLAGNFYIQDTCKNCGSKFLLVSGAVATGPATIPLTQYKTSWDGISVVTITN